MKTPIVYTSSTCPYCTLLKQFLDSQGIAYEERNVSLNRRYMAELAELGTLGVPTTVIDGQVIVGYRPQAILDAVGTAD
ncbi:MAG: glutaredoxin family protein [Bacillota bacterium]|nr:NrdH-redoxin [Bacillota bacterium]REJ36234.1 MAG: NrdH-redoxin [Bacillota bacterium]